MNLSKFWCRLGHPFELGYKIHKDGTKDMGYGRKIENWWSLECKYCNYYYE